MSNPLSTSDGVCSDNTPTSTAVKMIIEPKAKDLGGFSVRRALPYAKQRMVGPWVFFDHAGPVEFAPGQGIDVRPHPHIGLATVSYLLEGAVMHRDSLGCAERIVPGDINLMTAGRGIVHSERTPDDARAAGHTMELLQLWIALPDDEEDRLPAFDHYDGADMPVFSAPGVTGRVLMGAAHDKVAPVITYSPTVYVDYEMEAGAVFSVPPAVERAIYVLRGAVQIGDVAVATHTMAVLNPEADCVVNATSDARIVLVGGDPVGERLLFWNFVASSQDKIDQAKQDWKDGKFDAVPGDDEFIPLPD